MEVKYLNLTAQFKNNEKVKNVLEKIFTECQFVLGAELKEFEKNFAGLCGVNYAVGISNGTNALFLALKILGIGPGDEVITVPNSFLATVGAIVQAGAFPRLVDVADDYNIDPGKLEAAINKKTKAIIPVHLTGNPARMDEIKAIANKHNLYVIEDACQSIDAAIAEKKTGSLGDIAAFSLHPLKNLNTCGDGGIITTNLKDYHEKALLFRNHGLKNRNESEFFAYNFRLDSLKAAIANLQINDITKVTEKRNHTAQIYDSAFTGIPQIKIPERRTGVRQVFHTYIIQVANRNELMAFLENRGIETKIHYPIPIHLMEAAKPFGYKKGDFPKAEEQTNKIISLPIHQHLTKEQIDYVIKNIIEFYGI